MTFPQHPARVRVTLKGGAVRWLAQDPEAGMSGPLRWNLVDSAQEAGVWPWQEAVALEREVRQAWRQQYASAELVDEEEPE